ncbi:unnamed protein product [Pipistrellus nathusii]|uniref:Secreted protein n=1 Tax=Pipistrellus nathusii TaxID=59473 RepID=A0ABP0A809_PIPNA
MGLLLPFFLSPLHVKYCEEIALALFRLCCLKCTAQQSSSPPLLLPATSHSIIPHSKIVTARGCAPAALLIAWNDCFQIFLLDVNPVLAPGLIGRMRKASHRTSRGPFTHQGRQRKTMKSFEDSACPLVYNVLLFLFSFFSFFFF